jgi:hypothetical protein
MKRIHVLSLAASLAIPLALGACAVYEPAPAYPAYAYGPPPAPAYGYYPAYPRSSSTLVFRGDFGGGGRGGHHHHHRR